MQPESVIIQHARLIEPGHEFHQQTCSIYIRNGFIEAVQKDAITESAELILDGNGKNVSVGMFDLRCQLKDPGLEYQEDIQSGAAAAAASGFTGLAVQPTTDPIVQSKSQVEYINKQAAGLIAEIIPIGAATHNFDSEDINELFDMRQAGVRAFSNGDHSFASGGGLLRVLEYAGTLDTLIMSHAIDAHLAGEGMVNESTTTVHTGLRQQAVVAEFAQIQKEIEVARYTGSAIHFSHITSARSVEIIRKAKAEGLPVSCDVSIWHLVYTDANTLSFDSNFKVLPPFRQEEDREALIAGVNDGTIDAVVSDHNPQNVENKLVEFDYASYGIAGLQTFYSVYVERLSDSIDESTWWAATVSNPRKLLKLQVPSIRKGNSVNLRLEDPQATWVLDKSSNRSKSRNNPLWGNTLSGKCLFVMRGNHAERFD
ncbi:MAG: dihydroorotase [Flavobacteriales bacterium]|nr:dihydroorotase [Flavobacteriales bacterium]